MSELVVRKQRVVRRARQLAERGAVSAEYALLTVGTITFGGILLKILTDDDLRNQIMKIVLAIIKLILSYFSGISL